MNKTITNYPPLPKSAELNCWQQFDNEIQFEFIYLKSILEPAYTYRYYHPS